MDGQELFDDIIVNPFKYINKVSVNVIYYVLMTDYGPKGAFSGVVESFKINEKSNLDTIGIQGISKLLKVQRWAIISIEIDPEWQQRKSDNEKAMQILQDLSNRINRLELKLKSLGDVE